MAQPPLRHPPTVDDFIDDLDHLLKDDHYDWAAGALLGIRRTVEETDDVTPLQEAALERIRTARRAQDPDVLPSERCRRSRRYEGAR